METSVVTYGKREISYRIRRSSQRTTVAVTVAPGEGVVLVAPPETTVPRLDHVVRQKASWIVDRLRHVGEVEAEAVEKEFISGETFSYLGRNYRLQVEARVHPTPTKLDRGWLRVQVPKGIVGEDRLTHVRKALEAWYLERAQQRITERVEHWANKTGLVPKSIIVKNQSKRWGSCDAYGNLRFNWRIVQAPMSLLDYVVVHELAHLQHKDHTKAYWALVGKMMPRYESARDSLRILGTGLIW